MLRKLMLLALEMQFVHGFQSLEIRVRITAIRALLDKLQDHINSEKSVQEG